MTRSDPQHLRPYLRIRESEVVRDEGDCSDWVELTRLPTESERAEREERDGSQAASAIVARERERCEGVAPGPGTACVGASLLTVQDTEILTVSWQCMHCDCPQKSWGRVVGPPAFTSRQISPPQRSAVLPRALEQPVLARGWRSQNGMRTEASSGGGRGGRWLGGTRPAGCSEQR